MPGSAWRDDCDEHIGVLVVVFVEHVDDDQRGLHARPGTRRCDPAAVVSSVALDALAVAHAVVAVDDRGVATGAAVDAVAAAVDAHDPVAPAAAAQRVGVVAAGETVVARSAVERVAPAAALQRVVAGVPASRRSSPVRP